METDLLIRAYLSSDDFKHEECSGTELEGLIDFISKDLEEVYNRKISFSEFPEILAKIVSSKIWEETIFAHSWTSGAK